MDNWEWAENKLRHWENTGTLIESCQMFCVIRGAALCGRWSWDGAGIVTGGEDGAVKIWSRST